MPGKSRTILQTMKDFREVLSLAVLLVTELPTGKQRLARSSVGGHCSKTPQRATEAGETSGATARAHLPMMRCLGRCP
jgi:hypothetical protein